MSKNIMRTPEEKEKLVLEMINNGYGFHTMSKKHDISKSVLSKWYYSYKEKGIEAKYKYEEVLDKTFNKEYLKNMYNDSWGD